jgi:hypothetical protein
MFRICFYTENLNSSESISISENLVNELKSDGFFTLAVDRKTILPEGDPAEAIVAFILDRQLMIKLQYLVRTRIVVESRKIFAIDLLAKAPSIEDLYTIRTLNRLICLLEDKLMQYMYFN